ncbi:hypothetical protein SeMB42_g02769 [Synchytrium endobioticum]|uniref:FAD-binding domain-containing protein n=1 Tax=Synchytrium endobioticum TaxID=286115 RepID=A0A507DDP3_9FUNG|nr:hypothetical protein SeMB42_g02769 [Synchytrium endobioticum]
MLDVLIVGAAPTGLFMANELARYNIPFRIIEKAHAPNELSKALGVSARSMDILANRGMADVLHNQARKAHTVRLMQGSDVLTSIDFNSAPNETWMSRFSTMSVLPQSDMERILEQELRRLMNGRDVVERGAELDSYIDAPDGVSAVVLKRARDGTPVERETVKCAYLLGCDGAHSTVRHGVPGWGFEGHTLGCIWALADLVLDKGDDLLTEISLFYHPKGSVFVARYPDSYLVRVIYNITPFSLAKDAKSGTTGSDAYTEPAKLARFTLDDVNKGLAERTHGVLHAGSAKWVTTFKVSERRANGYRRGRVFIAGDAAHCHSPFLAIVLEGQAVNPEAVLNSYEQERLPVAEQTLAISGGLLRVATNAFAQSWFGEALSNLFFRNILPLIATTRAFKTTARKMVRQLDVNYTPQLGQSVLLKRLAPSLETAPGAVARVGDFAPEVIHLMNERLPFSAPARQTSLHMLLHGTVRFVLILFTSHESTSPSTNPLLRKYYNLLRKYPSTVAGLLISKFEFITPHTVAAAPSDVVVASEMGCSGSTLYGALHKSVLVLIRPDLYVGTMDVGENISEVENYLDELFGVDNLLSKL